MHRSQRGEKTISKREKKKREAASKTPPPTPLHPGEDLAEGALSGAGKKNRGVGQKLLVDDDGRLISKKKDRKLSREEDDAMWELWSNPPKSDDRKSFSWIATWVPLTWEAKKAEKLKGPAPTKNPPTGRRMWTQGTSRTTSVDDDQYAALAMQEAKSWLTLFQHYPFIVALGMSFYKCIQLRWSTDYRRPDGEKLCGKFTRKHSPVENVRLGYARPGRETALLLSSSLEHRLHVFSSAVIHDQRDIVSWVLQRDPTVAATDLRATRVEGVPFQHTTWLHFAASLGHDNIIWQLKLTGCLDFAEVESNSKDQTPLMAAAASGHVSTVKLLLGSTSHATLDLVRDGKTVLHHAYKSASVVRLLVEQYGVDINLKTENELAETVLWKAASYGKEEVVKYAISRGAVVEWKSPAGEFPFACFKGKPDFLRTILDAAAAAPTTNSSTPTTPEDDWFPRRRDLKGASLADIINIGSLEQDALEPTMLALLLENGVDIHKFDSRDGLSVLHLAVGHQLYDGEKGVSVVKQLIAAGADVNARRPATFPTHYPRSRDLPGGRRIRLKGTALPSATPLHCCVDMALARLLVQAGAQVNCQDSKGMTPLHWAAQLGLVAMVRLLLELGADRLLKDSRGWSAKQTAIEKKNLDIVAIL